MDFPLRDENDKTRLSYWFPKIYLAGINVPKTFIISWDDSGKEELSLLNLLDGKEPDGFDGLIQAIKTNGITVGTPFFLRTDYTSAKHYWENTCYVPDVDIKTIKQHVFEIVDFSACCDMMGLPVDRWVVREFLKTNPLFYAFKGMPINREFRFFVRDGQIEHIQPYWPENAVEQGSYGIKINNWKEILQEGNKFKNDEKEQLTGLTLKVNKILPGYWSVDWLLGADNKWYLTDMALGDHSYKYDPLTGLDLSI